MVFLLQARYDHAWRFSKRPLAHPPLVRLFRLAGPEIPFRPLMGGTKQRTRDHQGKGEQSLALAAICAGDGRES